MSESACSSAAICARRRRRVRVAVRRAGLLGADVERGGEVARVDPRVARGLGGGDDEPRERAASVRDARDVGPAAVSRLDEAVALEPLVGRADRVRVDAELLGEAVQRGQALARLERAAEDAAAQRPGELHADGDLGVPVERDVERVAVGGGHVPTVALLSATLTLC